MGKSSLSPQSRKVLYGIIGIALFIGAVLIIASVGQQLGTIFDNANAQNENETLSPSPKRINPLIPDVLGSQEADEEGNLLTNPGFEDPYITFAGEPDMLVAEGWTPWHFPQTEDMPSYSNLQPEYYGAYPDETRIRSGDNAQVISSFFATHDGGVYQTVTGLTPNQELLFSVYSYVWSNDFDSEESRQISTNPGIVTIQVGIDPLGGIDPDSENIIWSKPVEQYDAYRQYAISTRSTGDTVTVWVRSQIAYPQANNFIYLDDASLSLSIDQGIVTVTPTDSIALTVVAIPTNTPEGFAVPTNTSQALITNTPTRQPEMNVPTQSSGSDSSLTETAMAIPIILSTVTPSINLTRHPIGGDFPTPENVSILEASEATNVQVIDQSGAVIGTGLLRVYYASNVSPQNTTRVELELRFVEKFITATPFSDLTRVPVTPVTSTPQPMRPTATPRVPQHEESGVQVQQLMGASLFCLPESFSGCDESADPTAYAFIQEGGAFWSWTLRPQASVGVHDLRLELWTLLSVNGQTRPNTVWQYPFSITIGETPTPVESNSDPIRSILIVLIGTIGIVAMVVVFYIQRRSTANASIQKSATGKKPTVFLSYRRKVSWAVALKLHESLSQMGADVFMDMEDLGEGQFANKLMEEIQSRDYFVLLLAPDTLSSEWVMREAQYAMKAGKRIVPVLTDGFQLSEENLPPDLKSISSHNAVTLTLEFYDAGIKRIAKFLGL